MSLTYISKYYNSVIIDEISLNNPFNYNTEDIKDILVSDLLKNSSQEKVETFISNNLSQYDNFL